MPVIVDTGPLVGLINPKDRHHSRSIQIMGSIFDGKHGTAIIPDAVRIEALNFLQAKVGDQEVSKRLLDLMDRLVHTETDGLLLTLATELHLQEWDRRLSMTDCVVIEQARKLRAKAATLDGQWSGLVPLVE